MSRYGSMLRYRSQDSHVEIPMSRYRCRCAGQLSRYRYRGIDAELRIDVEIPMSVDIHMSRYRCRGVDVDVPDSYRDTDVEVSM